jgi:alkanesulfonate monooxygenase SsuD/methylene tetrahydromethanopterin reductase-like flavin-dependent oxidoreductase (luciferase family)
MRTPDRRLRLGLMPWLQATRWTDLLATARLIDRLGYDHLWAWDHLYAIFGDPHQPIYEGWTTLATYALATERCRIGLLVGANTFRSPGLVAKMATTVDHASGGRAILGLGGAWFEPEHVAFGIEFGSGHGERLGWLDESVGIIRRLLDGEAVTSQARRYRVRDLRLKPLPLQKRLPIMIGGSGERKTLRTVARYADMWNAMGPPERLRRKDEVLRRHCAEVGRDEAEIERTVACKLVIRDTEADAWRVWERQMAHNRTDPHSERYLWHGSPEQIAERWAACRELGFHTLIAELPAPYDTETIERLIGEVRPLLEPAEAADRAARGSAARLDPAGGR